MHADWTWGDCHPTSNLRRGGPGHLCLLHGALCGSAGAMFWAGYTPQYSAGLAIIAGSVLLLTGADMRIDLRRAAGRAEVALIGAARQVSLIAAIILCASIIVGVLRHHRAGGQDHLPDPVGVERWPVAFPSADSIGLSASGHGGADDCGLRDLRLGGRTGPDHAWPRAAAGASLRVLVRASLDHHPSGLRRCLHCGRNGGGELAACGDDRNGTRCGALPDPPRHDRASGPDPTGRSWAPHSSPPV